MLLCSWRVKSALSFSWMTPLYRAWVPSAPVRDAIYWPAPTPPNGNVEPTVEPSFPLYCQPESTRHGFCWSLQELVPTLREVGAWVRLASERSPTHQGC